MQCTKIKLSLNIFTNEKKKKKKLVIPLLLMFPERI